MNTEVFYFPVKKGPAKPAIQASVWEQAMNLVLVQREWADNAVSNTLNFKPKWTLLKSRMYETDDEYLDAVEHALIEHDFGHDKWDIEWCHTQAIEESTGYKLRLVYNETETYTERVVEVYQYNPQHEEDELEHVMAGIAPLIKSASMLPHTAEGAYEQMPEQAITEEEFMKMNEEIIPMDWSTFKGSDGIDEKFCTSESCEIKKPLPKAL
jgi:hypothetical protein